MARTKQTARVKRVEQPQHVESDSDSDDDVEVVEMIPAIPPAFSPPPPPTTRVTSSSPILPSAYISPSQALLDDEPEEGEIISDEELEVEVEEAPPRSSSFFRSDTRRSDTRRSYTRGEMKVRKPDVRTIYADPIPDLSMTMQPVTPLPQPNVNTTPLTSSFVPPWERSASSSSSTPAAYKPSNTPWWMR